MAANEVPTNDLGSLFSNLNLKVPQEIKKCLAEKRTISSKGRNEMISNSLVILKALINRDQPSGAEFEICAQKIELVPQMQDPVPPLRKDDFKPWVCLQFSLFFNLPTCKHLKTEVFYFLFNCNPLPLKVEYFLCYHHCNGKSWTTTKPKLWLYYQNNIYCTNQYYYLKYNEL